MFVPTIETRYDKFIPDMGDGYTKVPTPQGATLMAVAIAKSFGIDGKPGYLPIATETEGGRGWLFGTMSESPLPVVYISGRNHDVMKYVTENVEKQIGEYFHLPAMWSEETGYIALMVPFPTSETAKSAGALMGECMYGSMQFVGSVCFCDVPETVEHTDILFPFTSKALVCIKIPAHVID